jgi:hypothetical protein
MSKQELTITAREIKLVIKPLQDLLAKLDDHEMRIEGAHFALCEALDLIGYPSPEPGLWADYLTELYRGRAIQKSALSAVGQRN